MDEVVEHWPVWCQACAHVFCERELVEEAEPSRHQVAELPPIAVYVSEHRRHGVRCPTCAASTRAELPAGVPRSAFGPRLQAAVVTVAVRNRVSRRETSELARELFGVEVSTGSIDTIIQRAGDALAAPHTKLELDIKSAPVVNIDETGWVAHELFAAWDAYQQDGDRARLQPRIAPLQDRLHALLEHAARKSPRTKYHREFARNLLKRWPALWTFSHTPGVEPTNNHAERGLRGAVIYRKLSLGTQSEHGERTVERLLSASVTCRLRRQSLFAYLTQVLTAHARGDPVPALA